jgi:hypothetical protein
MLSQKTKSERYRELIKENFEKRVQIFREIVEKQRKLGVLARNI